MRLHHAAFAIMLSGAALPLPAQAQDLLGGSGILSILGITAAEPPGIDYRERPPLVVPPRSTLPTPQEREEARARANWPVDPDAERRRLANSNAPVPASERARLSQNQGARITNDELSRGRGGSGALSTGPVPSENDPGELLYAPMRQMREADRIAASRQQPEVPLGQEPPRRYLIEPPAGLRASTQRLAPSREMPAIRGDSTGQVEFVTGRPVPN